MCFFSRFLFLFSVKLNKSCLTQKVPDLSNLWLRKSQIFSQDNEDCKIVFNIMHQIFDIEVSSRKLLYRNEGFQEKVFNWFNGDRSLIEEFNQQKIVTVYNKWTRVTTAFNAIRGRKPQQSQNEQLRLVSIATNT